MAVRRRMVNRIYRDRMKFVVYMAVWFVIFFHILLFLFRIIVNMVVCFVCFFDYVQVSLMYSYCYVRGLEL